ncbi:MAG: hypothetical protein WCO90_01560 [Planctomycetota bacterium]
MPLSDNAAVGELTGAGDRGRTTVAAAQSDVVADAATAEKKPLQPERCRQAIGQTMALGSRR